MTRLTTLKNIGPQSAAWMESVGIDSAEKIFETGVIETYRQVKDAFPQHVTLNLLYALQGALLDLNWKDLPPDIKSGLLSQLQQAQQNY